MLDSRILKLDYGVAYGSVTLKSLQNDNIPEIDLLVREAIQNSSDAAIGVDSPFYKVNFQTGFFKPSDFNTYMTGAESILDSKYPMESARFLEIRDSRTTGLTGKIRKKDITPDDHGNFFKLIYDTGKKQTKKGAGGNWGFGKSVYYRVGAGIVIFYSRIKTDAGFESRLIITVVEDENDSNSLLKKIDPQSAGKAWWGIRDGEDLLPITDDEFINPVLSVFGLSPFSGNDTGTSIIIPYIDTEELMKNIIPSEINISDDMRARCIWAYDFDKYLALSIQKWYAPRIQNVHLKDFCTLKRLNVYVNGNPVTYESMLPFYQLVQELYTISLAKTYGIDYPSAKFDDTYCLPVMVRDYFDTAAGTSVSGYVTVVKVSDEKLNNGQNYVDPYIYLRHFERDPNTNEPIVMFAREPGMVIDYAITGPWVKGIVPPSSKDEYLFAFYVPIVEKHTKGKLSIHEYEDMELGEYLRSCEASDHMGWKDPSGMKIVDRIQRNTAAQIIKKYEQVEKKPLDATATKLSGWLGKRLLPKVGYLKKGGSGGSGGGGGGTGAKISDFVFEVGTSDALGNELTLDFSMKFKYSKKVAKAELIIDSEGGWIDPKAWTDDIGTQFPIKISSVEFSDMTFGSEGTNIPLHLVISADNVCQSCDQLQTELLKIDGTDIYTAIKVTSFVLNPEVHGKLHLQAIDKKYSFAFKVE